MYKGLTPQHVEEITVMLSRLRVLGCTSAMAHRDMDRRKTMVYASHATYDRIEFLDDSIPFDYIEAACAVFTHR